MTTLEYAEKRLDDAIKNGTQDDIRYWRGYRDAVKACAPGPNDPLTPDEMREMVGEPVCVYTKLGKRYRWRVISHVGEWLVDFTDGAHDGIDDLGKSWLAYRRRPEEV